MAEYRILEQIGEGAFGVVYRALQVELRREVALKVLRSELPHEELIRKRFERELQSCVALSHPNVVKIYDAGTLDGRLFVAMELVHGATLQQVIHDSGSMPVARAALLMVQAADALAHVHEKGLVHRDVKPANMMIDGQGRLTLMDFGLAKVPDATMITEQGATLGTPRYMAPETLEGRDHASPQDVWALALSTHELILGRNWVEGPIQVLLNAILGTAPITLRGLCEDVPGELLALQERALDRDPARRLTAAEYRDGLVGIVGSSSLVPVVPSGETARTTSAPDRRASGEHPPPERRASRAHPAGSQPGRGTTAKLAVITLAVAVLALLRALSPAPRPVPSRSVAEAVRLESPWFPGHRRLAGRLSRPAPQGATIDLVSAGRVLASTTSDAQGAFEFGGLEPAIAARLEARIPGSPEPIARLDVTTPRIVPLIDLAILPTDRSVLVDFDLPAGHAFSVEVGPWRERRVLGHKDSAASGFFRQEFLGLKPTTIYRLRITEKGGWASLFDRRFRTLPRAHAKWVADSVTAMEQSPDMAITAAEYLHHAPDTRTVAPFVRFLGRTDPNAFESITKLAWMAESLRDPELAEAYLRFFSRAREPGRRGDLLRALAASRHPRTLEVATSMKDLEYEGAATTAMGCVMRRTAAAGQWKTLASLLEQHPRQGHLVVPMAALDPEATRRLACQWLDASWTDDQRRRVAIRALAHLADDDAVRRLVGLLADPAAGSWREMVLHALVVIDSDATRAAVERLLGNATVDATGLAALWAATRLGLPAATGLASRMARAADASLRRDGIVCLALLGDARSLPLVRAGLSDMDPCVSQAAAWALGRLRDAPSAPSLLQRALADRDTGGVAAWALGQVGDRQHAAALRPLLGRLAAGPGLATQARLALVIWALGELGDAPARDEIRAISADERFTHLVRACARFALARLESAREPVHCVFPFVRYERLPLRVLPGESVDLSGQGYWTPPAPSGPMTCVDTPVPVSGTPATRPGTDLDLAGRPLVQNLTSFVGSRAMPLAAAAQSLTAERAGALVLSPLGSDWFHGRPLPAHPALGMAWVRFEL